MHDSLKDVFTLANTLENIHLAIATSILVNSAWSFLETVQMSPNVLHLRPVSSVYLINLADDCALIRYMYTILVLHYFYRLMNRQVQISK